MANDLEFITDISYITHDEDLSKQINYKLYYNKEDGLFKLEKNAIQPVSQDQRKSYFRKSLARASAFFPAARRSSPEIAESIDPKDILTRLNESPSGKFQIDDRKKLNDAIEELTDDRQLILGRLFNHDEELKIKAQQCRLFYDSLNNAMIANKENIFTISSPEEAIKLVRTKTLIAFEDDKPLLLENTIEKPSQLYFYPSDLEYFIDTPDQELQKQQYFDELLAKLYQEIFTIEHFEDKNHSRYELIKSITEILTSIPQKNSNIHDLSDLCNPIHKERIVEKLKEFLDELDEDKSTILGITALTPEDLIEEIAEKIYGASTYIRPQELNKSNQSLLTFFKIDKPKKDTLIRGHNKLNKPENSQESTYETNKIDQKLRSIRHLYEKSIGQVIENLIQSELRGRSKEIKKKISQEIKEEFLKSHDPAKPRIYEKRVILEKKIKNIIVKNLTPSDITANSLNYRGITANIFRRSQDVINRKLYYQKEELQKLIDSRTDRIKEQNAQTAKKIALEYKKPNPILTSVEALAEFSIKHRKWLTKQAKIPRDKKEYITKENITKKIKYLSLGLSNDEIGPIAGILTIIINKSVSAEDYFEKIFSKIKELESQYNIDQEPTTQEHQKYLLRYINISQNALPKYIRDIDSTSAKKKYYFDYEILSNETKKDPILRKINFQAIRNTLRATSKNLQKSRKENQYKAKEYEKISDTLLKSKKSPKPIYTQYLYFDNKNIESPLYQDFFNSKQNDDYTQEIKKYDPTSPMDLQEINNKIADLSNFYSDQLWNNIYSIIENDSKLKGLSPEDKSDFVQKIHEITINKDKNPDIKKQIIDQLFLLYSIKHYDVPEGSQLTKFIDLIGKSIKTVEQRSQSKILEIQRLVAQTQLKITINNIEFAKQEKESLDKTYQQYFLEQAFLLSLSNLYNNRKRDFVKRDNPFLTKIVISTQDIKDAIEEAIEFIKDILKPDEIMIRKINSELIIQLEDFIDCRTKSEFEIKSKEKTKYLPKKLGELIVKFYNNFYSDEIHSDGRELKNKVQSDAAQQKIKYDEAIQSYQDKDIIFKDQLEKAKKEKDVLSDRRMPLTQPATSPTPIACLLLNDTQKEQVETGTINKINEAISALNHRSPSRTLEEEIISDTLKSQESRSVPDHAYRGIGLLLDFTQNNKLTIKQVLDGSNPERFINYNTCEVIDIKDMVNKHITKLSSDGVNWINVENTEERKKETSKIFHGDSNTYMQFEDGTIAVCELRYKEIFVTNQCQSAVESGKDDTLKQAKTITIAKYNPEIHGSEAIDKNNAIKRAIAEESLRGRAASR